MIFKTVNLITQKNIEPNLYGLKINLPVLEVKNKFNNC